MNDQELNAKIANYSRDNLSPTPQQRSKISSRYAEISGFLGGSCFMAGSYARYTAVRPPKDLDVIWVCDDVKLTHEPRRILDNLALHLKSCYRDRSSERVTIEIQDHSITVIFEDDPDNFSIDVVPAGKTEKVNEFGDSIYCVPEIQKLSHTLRKSFSGPANWILSDPKGYISEASDLEELTSGRFRKTAKIVKSWRQKHKVALGDAFKLKSFHVEQLVTRHLSRQPNDTITVVLRTVFGGINAAIEGPSIRDRADNTVFIDQYVVDLTPSERAKILHLQREAFELVTRLETASDDREINKILDQLTQSKVSAVDFVAPAAVIIARPPQPYADNG